MKTHKIAVIAGDGIGKEVMPEGLRALEATAKRFDIHLEFTTFAWADCDYYLKHGKMMPDDWNAQLSGFEAIFFGAVGAPDVPDHITLWGLRLAICQPFDQYANVRPTRILVPCPPRRAPGSGGLRPWWPWRRPDPGSRRPPAGRSPSAWW